MGVQLAAGQGNAHPFFYFHNLKKQKYTFSFQGERSVGCVDKHRKIRKRMLKTCAMKTTQFRDFR